MILRFHADNPVRLVVGFAERRWEAVILRGAEDAAVRLCAHRLHVANCIGFGEQQVEIITHASAKCWV